MTATTDALTAHRAGTGSIVREDPGVEPDGIGPTDSSAEDHGAGSPRAVEIPPSPGPESGIEIPQ